MPGHQKAVLDDLVEVSVQDDLELGKSVYFTDQHPSFQLEVVNLSDETVWGKLVVGLVFESPEIHGSPSETYEMKIESNGSQEVTFEPGLLAHQGTAVLSVSKGSNFHQKPPEERATSGYTPPQLGDPIHTFTVWDRDFYKINYVRPRWGQYLAAILAVLIILVGVAQLWLC